MFHPVRRWACVIQPHSRRLVRTSGAALTTHCLCCAGPPEAGRSNYSSPLRATTTGAVRAHRGTLCVNKTVSDPSDPSRLRRPVFSVAECILFGECTHRADPPPTRGGHPFRYMGDGTRRLVSSNCSGHVAHGRGTRPPRKRRERQRRSRESATMGSDAWARAEL